MYYADEVFPEKAVFSVIYVSISYKIVVETFPSIELLHFATMGHHYR